MKTLLGLIRKMCESNQANKTVETNRTHELNTVGNITTTTCSNHYNYCSNIVKLATNIFKRKYVLDCRHVLHVLVNHLIYISYSIRDNIIYVKPYLMSQALFERYNVIQI